MAEDGEEEVDPEQVASCKVWEHMKNCELFYITEEHIEELVVALQADPQKPLTTEIILKLVGVENLGIQDRDVHMLCQDSDCEGLGYFSISDLHKAFVQGEVAFGVAKRSLHYVEKDYKVSECRVNELIDWMHYEYETKQALWSLPQTLALFGFFSAAVTMHLQVFDAFAASRLFMYLTDWGDILRLFNYDRFSYMHWLKGAWIHNYFKWNLNTDPFPGRLGREFQLIGAVRLRRKWRPFGRCGEIADVWLDTYDSTGQKQCHQQGEEQIDDVYLLYHESLETIQERLQNMSDTYWFDSNTTWFNIEAVGYNPHQGVISYSRTNHEIEPSGFIRARTPVFAFANVETFLADPYPEIWSATPDFLYVSLIVSIFYAELKELIPAALNGLDGIKDYMGFWNIVDWVAILSGFFIVGMWMNVVLMIVNNIPPILGDLPTYYLDQQLLMNRTYFTMDEIESIMGDLGETRASYEGYLASFFSEIESISDSHRMVRWLIVVYLTGLMMKFFKAFRANERLDIVIKTITDSAVDVGHFMIAFFSMFLCYAMAGMLLFGFRVMGFSSVIFAIYFNWRGGVGLDDIEFHEEWYQVVCYCWSMTYQLLIMTLMLNILVGLIFEAYGRIHGAAGQPPTLVEQVFVEASKMRLTKAFLDEWYLICELEDDNFPAHPRELVTLRSLRAAFSKDKMTKQNAEYLIACASAWAAKKAGETSMELIDGVRLIGHVKTNALKTVNLLTSLEMLSKIEIAKPQQLEAAQPLTVAQSSSASSQAATLAPWGNSALQLAVVQQGEPQLTEDEVFDKVNEVTAMLAKVLNDNAYVDDVLAESMERHHANVQDKISWAQRKLVTLVDRCEQTEIGMGKLSECFAGVDSHSLKSMPTKLLALADWLRNLRQQKDQASSCATDMSPINARLDSISDDIKSLVVLNSQQVDSLDALRHVESGIAGLRQQSGRR